MADHSLAGRRVAETGVHVEDYCRYGSQRTRRWSAKRASHRHGDRERYYRSLFNFFANRPTLREEADDLVQDTFARAFKQIDKYGFKSSFGAWLRTIGENVWKNAVRDRRRIRRGGLVGSFETFDDDTVTLPASEDRPPSPEEQALAAERTQVLGKALASLPPGMRVCTELRLGHLQYQEIADVTGIGLGTVRSQLFEARKRLRPILDRYFSGTDI
jgi:RNA polymerase sigma-70 factor (ECF subfamily)